MEGRMNSENARAHGIETSESLDEVRARHRAEKEEAIAAMAYTLREIVTGRHFQDAALMSLAANLDTAVSDLTGWKYVDAGKRMASSLRVMRRDVCESAERRVR